MTKLEDFLRGTQIRGILPNQFVTLIDAQQHGETVVEVILGAKMDHLVRISLVKAADSVYSV